MGNAARTTSTPKRATERSVRADTKFHIWGCACSVRRWTAPSRGAWSAMARCAKSAPTAPQLATRHCSDAKRHGVAATHGTAAHGVVAADGIAARHTYRRNPRDGHNPWGSTPPMGSLYPMRPPHPVGSPHPMESVHAMGPPKPMRAPPPIGAPQPMPSQRGRRRPSLRRNPWNSPPPMGSPSTPPPKKSPSRFFGSLLRLRRLSRAQESNHGPSVRRAGASLRSPMARRVRNGRNKRTHVKQRDKAKEGTNLGNREAGEGRNKDSHTPTPTHPCACCGQAEPADLPPHSGPWPSPIYRNRSDRTTRQTQATARTWNQETTEITTRRSSRPSEESNVLFVAVGAFRRAQDISRQGMVNGAGVWLALYCRGGALPKGRTSSACLGHIGGGGSGRCGPEAHLKRTSSFNHGAEHDDAIDRGNRDDASPMEVRVRKPPRAQSVVLSQMRESQSTSDVAPQNEAQDEGRQLGHRGRGHQTIFQNCGTKELKKSSAERADAPASAGHSLHHLPQERRAAR